MKTTIDIADSLLTEAKAQAAARGTTVRALVEAGLRHVLHSDATTRSPFVLRRASFRGQGLQPDARGEGWDALRERIYEGRGG